MHPNMTEETKKSKLCLITPNIKDISFSKEDLSIAQNQLNNTTSNISNNSTKYGKVAADKLFDEFFGKKLHDVIVQNQEQRGIFFEYEL
ncbi:22012_t:CDS:2 [Gigaspora rosea]|nr:22012_t:CDS:2 [Gigaspora rosea]